ncbi:MAG: hypothetical protein ACRDXE_00835, partial [Acidimicrobiales bacterium]
ALADAVRTAHRVLVYEVNAGQMIDDVRLAVAGACPVQAIGRVSIDSSGMRQGEILDVRWLRDRVLGVLGLDGATGGGASQKDRADAQEGARS